MPASRKVHGLIAAVAGGNTQAFEELYRLSCPKLYGLALRVLRQNDLAASAMRRAFIQIRADAHRHSPQEDPVGFLVARLRAATFDIARTGAGIDAWEPFEVDNPARDPLALGGRSPALTRLLTCLGALPEERRRMVLLAYYDGWSRDALAIVFDAPVAAVRALIARSTDQIAECLGKKPPVSFSDVDRHMAAEYALGTLDAEERTAVRAQMEQAPEFGKLVRQWERRLAPLHELAAPVAPPPGLWTAIAGDLRRQPGAAIAPRVPVAVAPAAGAPGAGVPNAAMLASPPDGPAAGRTGGEARPVGARKQGLFSFMLERVTGRPSSGASRGTRGGRPAPLPLPIPVVAIPPAPPAAAEAEVAVAEEPLPLLSPVPPPPRRSASVQRHPVRSAVAPKAPSGPPLDAEARAAAFRALAEAIDLRIGAAEDASTDLAGPSASEVPPAVGATASPAVDPAPVAQPDDAARAAAFRLLAEAIDSRIGDADEAAAEPSGVPELDPAPAPEVLSSAGAAAHAAAIPAAPDDAARAAAFRALAEAIDLRIGGADGTPPAPAVPSAHESELVLGEGAGDGAVASTATAVGRVIAAESAAATLPVEAMISAGGDGPPASAGTAPSAETGAQGGPDGGGAPPEPHAAAGTPEAVTSGPVETAGGASATSDSPGPTAASLPAPYDLPRGASAGAAMVAEAEVAGSANAPASADATGAVAEADIAQASEADGPLPSRAEGASPAAEAPQPEDTPQPASAVLLVAEDGLPDEARPASEVTAPLHGAPAPAADPAPDGPAASLRDAPTAHEAEAAQPRQAEEGGATVQAAEGTAPAAARTSADAVPAAAEQDGPSPSPNSGRDAPGGAADADLQSGVPAGAIAFVDHRRPTPAMAGVDASPSEPVPAASPPHGLAEPGVSPGELVATDTPPEAAFAQLDGRGAARAEPGTRLAEGAAEVPAAASAASPPAAASATAARLLPAGTAEAAPAAIDDEGPPATAGPGNAGRVTSATSAVAEVPAAAATASPPATDSTAPARLLPTGMAEAMDDEGSPAAAAPGDAAGATAAAATAVPPAADAGARARLLPTGMAEAIDDGGPLASAGPGGAGGAASVAPAEAGMSPDMASVAPSATDAGAPATFTPPSAAEAAPATHDDAARLSGGPGDAGGATSTEPEVAEPHRGGIGVLASPAPSAAGAIGVPGGEAVPAAADEAEQIAAAPSGDLSPDATPAAGDVAQAVQEEENPVRPAVLLDGALPVPRGAQASEPGAGAAPAIPDAMLGVPHPAVSSPGAPTPPLADVASQSVPEAPPDPAAAGPQPIVLPPPVFKSAGLGAPAAASPPAPEAEVTLPPEILAASLARWRRAGVVLSALVVALGAYGLHRTLWPVTGDRYVSVLQREPSPALSIRLDPQDGVVRVQVLAPDLPAGGRYALWLVTEKSGTHLISRFSGATVAHSAALKRIGKAGLANATLTVTVEPSEAAVVPLAPGANVVYRGRLAPE